MVAAIPYLPMITQHHLRIPDMTEIPPLRWVTIIMTIRLAFIINERAMVTERHPKNKRGNIRTSRLVWAILALPWWLVSKIFGDFRRCPTIKRRKRRYSSYSSLIANFAIRNLLPRKISIFLIKSSMLVNLITYELITKSYLTSFYYKLYSRTKHISLRENFVREQSEAGEVSPTYVATDSNISDGMTKPLSRAKIEEHSLELTGMEVIYSN